MRFFAILALFAVTTFAAESLQVERKVEGQTLISKSLPAATLTFAPAFKYLGGQRIILYDVADAEQHFFVDADKNGNIRRMYWLQFEHFLPNDTHTYGYRPVRTTKIGPLEFIHDTKIFTDYAGDMASDAQSDSAHVSAFMEAHGLKLPKSVARIRMFHLPNSDNRSELMLIYVEAVDPKALPEGVTAEAPADDKYPDVAKAILQRAKANLKLESPNGGAATP